MLEGDGEQHHPDRLGGHEQGNVRVSEDKMSTGREGRQHCNFNSATSPLEGVKLVISGAASSNQKVTVLLVIDVRRAYFYAKARRRVYIELPEGRQCGLLKNLYGTRDAAQKLGIELGGLLEESGFAGEESVLRYTVMMSLARPPGKPQWLLQKFTETYEIKTQMIGDAADRYDGVPNGFG